MLLFLAHTSQCNCILSHGKAGEHLSVDSIAFSYTGFRWGCVRQLIKSPQILYGFNCLVVSTLTDERDRSKKTTRSTVKYTLCNSYKGPQFFSNKCRKITTQVSQRFTIHAVLGLIKRRKHVHTTRWQVNLLIKGYSPPGNTWSRQAIIGCQ